MPKRTKITSADPSFNPMPLLMGVLLFLATFFAYRPAASGGYIWDDDDYVSLNPAVQSLSGLPDIWLHPTASPQYYPMVFTTFWAQAQLGSGTEPFHEVNILLHAASAILLWRILLRLKIPGAFFAAMIFALHPVMVESVAWITERKNTLSLLFYLGSFYTYLRFARIDPSEAAKSPRQFAWYIIALLLFIFALLSKTVTATLPAAILLILWCKRRTSLRDIFLLLPFFALGLAASLMTTYMEHSIGNVGATGPEWNYTFTQRILIAGRAVWFYAAKLLWPANLTFVYPKWNIDPAAAWQWILPAALVIVIAALFALQRGIGRGPLVAVLFFVGTLLPALGFINVYPMRYTFVADHYQYQAAIGLIVLFAALGAQLAHRSVTRRSPWALPAAASIIVLTLFLLTLRQSSIYEDKLKLWTDTAQKNPGSWMVWINLGDAQATRKTPDLQAAEMDYRKALELAPSIADPHYNVGMLDFEKHDYPAAEAQFRRAAQIEPRHANALDMLGQTLIAEKRVEEGIKGYRAAIAANPRHNLAHYNLGIALRDQGHLDQAAAEFAQAADISPADPRPLRDLAACLFTQKKYDPAIDALERLLKLNSNDADAHWNLSFALKGAGRSDDEARQHFERALQLKPELAARLQKK